METHTVLEVQIVLDDRLSHGRALPDLQQALQEGLIIREYLRGGVECW